MDAHTTLPAEVRVSLTPVIQAYLAFQDAQITVMREQIVTLPSQLSKLPLHLGHTKGRKSPHSGEFSRSPSQSTRPAPQDLELDTVLRFVHEHQFFDWTSQPDKWIGFRPAELRR